MLGYFLIGLSPHVLIEKQTDISSHFAIVIFVSVDKTLCLWCKLVNFMYYGLISNNKHEDMLLFEL